MHDIFSDLMIFVVSV